MAASLAKCTVWVHLQQLLLFCGTGSALLMPGFRPHSQEAIVGHNTARKGEPRHLGCHSTDGNGCWSCDPGYYDDTEAATSAPSVRCEANICTPIAHIFPPPTPLEALNLQLRLLSGTLREGLHHCHLMTSWPVGWPGQNFITAFSRAQSQRRG